MSSSRRTVLLLGAALPPDAARAELADSVARDVAANPALAAIAKRNPATARKLASDANRLLAAPPGGARSGGEPDADEWALLRGNPLLDAVYRHDPAAALDLLARIRQAGGTRR
jgi:hypothetical protein